MEEIIKKNGLDFDLELLSITPATGEIKTLINESQSADKSGSIYDKNSIMRVLCQKATVISDAIADELYTSVSNEVSYFLTFSSFEQLVCIVHLNESKTVEIGQIITLLKEQKETLVKKCRTLLPKDTPRQVFNTGVRTFPRYNTSNINTAVEITGIDQAIKLVDASVAGICIKAPVPSNILETTKKIKISFSKFKYEFMVTVMWTHTDSNRDTQAGLRIDFQSKQELASWQTFIYALFIKQKK